MFFLFVHSFIQCNRFVSRSYFFLSIHACAFRLVSASGSVYALCTLCAHWKSYWIVVCVRFSFFLCTCCVSHWTLARVLIHSHTYTGLQTRELISILHLINILHTLSPPPISIALYRLVISIFLVIYFAVEEKRQPKTETAFFQLAALTGCALCTWLTEHEWCTNCNGIRFFFHFFSVARTIECERVSFSHLNNSRVTLHILLHSQFYWLDIGNVLDVIILSTTKFRATDKFHYVGNFPGGRERSGVKRRAEIESEHCANK